MRRRHRSPGPGQLDLGLDEDPRAIAKQLRDELLDTAPNSLFIPEFGIAARRVRIDLAQVDQCLAGFEIKGARDNLGRLLHQTPAFSATFERMTLVTATSHASAATHLVPAWWGLVVVTPDGFHESRPGRLNPDLDGAAVAGLLWREEAQAVAVRRCAAPRGLPRARAVEWIAARLDPASIAEEVRNALRSRSAWRAAA